MRIAFSVNYKSIKNKANYSCTHSHVITFEDVLNVTFLAPSAHCRRWSCMNGHIDQPIEIECPLQTIQKQIIFGFVEANGPLKIQYSPQVQSTRTESQIHHFDLWQCKNFKCLRAGFWSHSSILQAKAPFFILSLISGPERDRKETESTKKELLC